MRRLTTGLGSVSVDFDGSAHRGDGCPRMPVKQDERQMLLKGVSFFAGAQPDSESCCMVYTKCKGLLRGLECLFWSDVLVSFCSVWRGLAGLRAGERPYGI